MFDKKKGFIVLDQIRTIDKTRIVKCLGLIDKKGALMTLKILQEMFEP